MGIFEVKFQISVKLQLNLRMMRLLECICFRSINQSPHPGHVFSLEINLYAENRIPSAASASPSRRFFSTHMPYASLPEAMKRGSECKVVYVCRNPKDTFVSLWLFMNKIRLRGTVEIGIEEAFEKFMNGAVGYGPFWDHVVECWKESKESSEKVLFVKYEDMKGEPRVQLRRMAEFLGCPFSAAEEESGVVDGILEKEQNKK